MPFTKEMLDLIKTCVEFYNKYKLDDIPKMKTTVIGRKKIIRKLKKEKHLLQQRLEKANQYHESMKLNDISQEDYWILDQLLENQLDKHTVPQEGKSE